nr:NADH:ubiquinone oxidoreductase [Polyrhizophydium stewartii]
MQPMRYLTRFKKREVLFVEGDCKEIDNENQTIHVVDNSEIVGQVSEQKIPYDYLIVACGAENATFGIPGVHEHACFLKEAWDAKKIRTRLMDCLETAAFPGQTEDEIRRILHMVVVGGGPTGVEYAAELHDFLHEDLLDWYPDLAGKIKITLVEAMPHVLPMFSKQLIDYTEKHFAHNKVDILNNTAVKKVNQRDIVVQDANKELHTIPYGLLVWATGNTARPVVQNLIKSLPSTLQNQRHKVASRQGAYLARVFNTIGPMDDKSADAAAVKAAVEWVGPFKYEHLGSLAYIGGDRAIADLPIGVHIGGALTYYFWRSAYLSNLFSMRNRVLVAFDWTKKTVFGRDISRE